MSEYPFIRLPQSDTTEYVGNQRLISKITKPVISEQAQLVIPKLTRLKDTLDARRIEVVVDAPSVEPEYALVIETYEPIPDFFKAVKKIDGLEWLAEYELPDIEPTEHFQYQDDERLLSGQLLMVLSNRRATDEFLGLWERYIENNNMTFPRGLTKFRDLFLLLKDIRYWGVEDRLKDTGVLEDWEDKLNHNPDEPVKFEIELWFRENEEKRIEAVDQLREIIRGSEGDIITQTCIPEIQYHALLAELPTSEINKIIAHDYIKLVKCDHVMLFRPHGQMIVEPLWDEGETESLTDENSFSTEDNSEELLPPVVALLDGLPMANHSLLQKHIIVDDPDDYSSTYEVDKMTHGTSMSSLIIHGDLNNSSGTINSKLYVRPIMKPTSQARGEGIDENTLPLDLIHRAVSEIFANDLLSASIKVINLSIGDPLLQFAGKMSPLAKLIDWLSYKYNVLFIVSAGNHLTNIDLPIPSQDFRALSKQEQAKTIFQIHLSQSSQKRILSPSDSLNAICVGALHSDESNYNASNGIMDVYEEELPAVYSAQGNGYLRSIKPDVVIGGGRLVFREPYAAPSLRPFYSAALIGQKVATASTRELNRTTHTIGTSNSTALVSRLCAQLSEILKRYLEENDISDEVDAYMPLLLKGLVVHSATSQEIANRISNLSGGVDNATLKKMVAQNIGYGKVNPDRIKGSLEKRVTLFNFDSISNRQSHIYEIPLPEQFGGANHWRRITVTLVWFTKPCCSKLKYRRENLWFELDGDNKEFVKRASHSADWNQVKRGTVQHEVFESDRLAVIGEDKNIRLKVNCREVSERFSESVKYALCITFETADEVDVSLYQEIKTKIIERTRVETIGLKVS
ncbi:MULTISPECIES: S8 family peptidase [Acinetobacter]|uniref:S8 family peptidase n=1 Tax=Acinetobacter TaxID=469 RepID=UPI00125088EF|nr:MULTISPECIES: S8 family peptidase [Acinetobacter]